MSGPCNWPVSYAGCGGTMPEPLASMPASGVEVFESMATEYLWRWTERRFGECPVTVRPCRQDCNEASTFLGGQTPYLPGRGAPWIPALVDGKWYNIGCSCGDMCSCAKVQQISLPGPIMSVDEVIIDGQLVLGTAYQVQNDKWLVRVDGGSWPTCNDLSADSSLGLGQPGTWQVTYTKGSEVPIGGQVAAGVLAVEFAKSACGDKDCALPKRLASISRQGVTMAVLDTFDDIEVGHTGIWVIDSWVASVRKAPQRSRVASPDTRPVRRTTWQN